MNGAVSESPRPRASPRRPALQIAGVWKAYGPTQALRDLSLALRPGRVSALLGSNGSGKSTLIRILAGVEQADRGWLEIAGERYSADSVSPDVARAAGLHVVHQERSIFPQLCVAENLAIGTGFATGRGGRIRWGELNRRAAEVLERFEIAARPEQQLASLSPSGQTMVAIARALQHQEGARDGILILDEPTASLPVQEVDRLLAALRRYAAAGQTILFVTHRLPEVRAIADDVMVLRDGRLVGELTGPDLDEGEMVDLLVGTSTVQRAAAPAARAAAAPFLAVDHAAGGSARDVTMTAAPGEVVGLAGLLGSGRSSVLKLLCGAVPLRAGRITLDGRAFAPRHPSDAIRAGIAYIPEDRIGDAAFPAMDVTENASALVLSDYWRNGRLRHSEERRDARDVMGSFDVRAPSETAPFGALSGGNQQKLVLARSLRRGPKLLLLDEPTQGVDVGARAQLHGIIRDAVAAGAAAVIVSSDFDELEALCDRVVVLVGGAVGSELSGAELTAERVHRAAFAAGAGP
ncbi:MAG: ribose transport system ATP-binding protein [Thermoleophilaceae bacterium]|nr:ribose transport system ATP-binding protein [Thermoleophilaceae bacterium]